MAAILMVPIITREGVEAFKGDEMHVYEVRPRKDHRGLDLISDALRFGRLWYGEPNAISNAVDYAKFRSRSHDPVICVCGETGNVLDPVGVIFSASSHQRNIRCISGMCHLFQFSYHRHEPFFD